MTIIHSSDSPTFTPPGATITGLASPSRGSLELSVWKVRLGPGSTPEHTLDAEEIFAVLSGTALCRSGENQQMVQAGDTIIVAPGDRISFHVEKESHLEAICAMRVGAQATMVKGASVPFLPPWTV